MSDDPINPFHYRSVDGSDVDCLKAQSAALGREQMRGYHRGNIIKYIWRYLRKNGQQDLRKAARHIGMLMQLECEEPNDIRHDAGVS